MRSQQPCRLLTTLRACLSAWCLLIIAAPGLCQEAHANQELPNTMSSGAPAIVSVSANAEKVGLYRKFELTIELAASYDNPFDPEQVDLVAEFTAPSEEKTTVPGFFYQAYENRNAGDDSRSPLLEAAGDPCWKVRFAPTEIGRYAYVIRLRNRFGDVAGEVTSEPGRFEAVESQAPGFIRICSTNKRYFQHDDGTPFFPVGQNLQNDWHVYRHSRLLAEAGANCARVWTFCHWTWLEWAFKGGIKWAGPGHWMRSYDGAGKYNQRVAWISDHHLDQWTRDGLSLMFCLGNGSELAHADRYDSWGGHPYNVANGGFLKDGKEFWTDPRARKLYKQRLRYIVARYGYSPNVWAWEFWNELGRETDETVAWHAEMASCLRTIDANRHLITTSFWGTNAEVNHRTWAIPEIDFTQTHNYAGPATIRARTRSLLRSIPKPHIVGEGGGPHPGQDGSMDPEGIDFHNSLWAAAMSGAAGTTLPWWWRQRIEPKNLFFHYAAIARFAQAVPWTTEPLQPLEPDTVRVSAPPGRTRFSPVLFVPLGSGWGARSPRNRFEVQPDGAVAHLDQFGAVLFGSGRADWANPPTIDVEYPTPGRFIVHVSETSHAVLQIELDGEVALRDDTLNVSRKPVRTDFAISVPEGRHEITLRNVGGDWLRIARIVLTNYRDTAAYPDLDVFGLQSDEMLLLWVHNRLNQWPFKVAGFDAEPIGPAVAMIAGIRDDRYAVEWWDTYKGEIARSDDVTVTNGVLELPMPAIQTDVTCKIRRYHDRRP